MRLNGWKRIGAIASVVWMLGGSIWFTSVILSRANREAGSAYDFCQETKHRGPPASDIQKIDCAERATRARRRSIETESGNLTPVGAGAVGALLVLLVAYLLSWVVWKGVLWVRGGFQNR